MALYKNSISPLDPVYVSLTAVNFNNSCLDELLYRMNSYAVSFNVNVTADNKIEPLETILGMMKSNEKMTVTKVNMNKKGEVIFRIILNEFQFISIDNLLDFNYSQSNEIMKLNVYYTFKDMEYININERFLKIYKILKKDYKGYHLTRKEINIK